MQEGLTHFDPSGNAIMVDVSEKEITARCAVASGTIAVNAAVMDAIVNKTAKKGDVLGVARVAGIMAANNTAGMIPLCHPLPITKCTLDFDIDAPAGKITARCTVKVDGKTGVEMEALTGVSVALLTVYDMCKALDRAMEIGQIHLEEKYGGKSGVFRRGE